MALKLAWHHRILIDGSLTALAKNVASVLLHYLNTSTRDCWLSQDHFAAFLGCTRRAVQDSLNALAYADYITVTPGRGRGRTNRYAAVFATDEAAEKANGGAHQSDEKANVGSPHHTEKVNLRSEKGESSFAHESLNESLNPPLPPKTPGEAFDAMRRLWPHPVRERQWDYARMSFNRHVEAGELDVSRFFIGVLGYRRSLGKDGDEPPTPLHWITNRDWLNYPATSGSTVVPFVPSAKRAA